MYWKRPKMSVLPYLLVFFSDTELLFNVEFAGQTRRCSISRTSLSVLQLQGANT